MKTQKIATDGQVSMRTLSIEPYTRDNNFTGAGQKIEPLKEVKRQSKIALWVMFGLLSLIQTTSAHNKVVVITLGADEGTTVFKESEIGNTRDESNQAHTYFESEIVGSISSAGDVDYYRIILPYCTRLTAETEAIGGDRCGTGGTIDSKVTILNRTETQTLGSNDDISNANSCSRAVGVSTSVGQINFYLVKVEASPISCDQCTFNYKLKLSSQPSLC